MKYNNNYVLKELAGDTILVYQNENEVNFSKIITLNDVSVVILKSLQEGLSQDKIIERILSEYEIDKETVANDVEEFIKKLLELGVVIND